MRDKSITKKVGGLGILVVIALGGLFILGTDNQAAAVPRDSNGEMYDVKVYKSPTCGCCTVHGDYLAARGYEVEQIDVEDMEAIKDQYGVPQDLTSCHTTVVNDGKYVIEGHIPTEAIDKLLGERPDVHGIGMPGMPSGSPGMGGAKTETWDIQQINQDGSLELYKSI